MNHFGSLTQDVAAKSAFSLYTPYLVIFVLASLAAFKIISETEYIGKLDSASTRAISAGISLLIGAISAIVLRPMLFSITGI